MRSVCGWLFIRRCWWTAIVLLALARAVPPLWAVAGRPNIFCSWWTISVTATLAFMAANRYRLRIWTAWPHRVWSVPKVTLSSPVCSPSRAGFLTGRNQVAFGLDNRLDATQPGFDPDFAGLPVTEKTRADRLRAAG